MFAETATYKGQRAELSLRERQLRMKMCSLRRAMRANLNEITDEECLPAEEILLQASELRSTQVDLEEVRKDLKTIKDILGD